MQRGLRSYLMHTPGSVMSHRPERLPRIGELPASIRVARLPTDCTTSFSFVPTAVLLCRISEEAGVLAIRKLRLAGTLKPLANGDWLLRAQLGATVTQECVLTLQPVRTRVDVRVGRTFVTDKRRYNPLPDFRMPNDENLELLLPEIDLYELALEVIVLEIPLYPHAIGARLDAPEDGTPNSASSEATMHESPLSNLSELYRRARS